MTFPSGDTFVGSYERIGDTSLRQGESRAHPPTPTFPQTSKQI